MGLPGRALRAKAYAPRNQLLIKLWPQGIPPQGLFSRGHWTLCWLGMIGKAKAGWESQKIPFGNVLGSNLHTAGRLRFDGTMRTATLGPNGLPKAQRF